MVEPEALTDALDAFSDLGTKIRVEGTTWLLVRHGIEIRIARVENWFSLQSGDSAERRHYSVSSLLSDESIANLARVASNQNILLSPKSLTHPIPVSLNMKAVEGQIPAFREESQPWSGLHEWLHAADAGRKPQGIDFLLVDGPAGVGKSTIIRETALLFARNYSRGRPIILQIASRGRILQNIADLIAYALQDIRAEITVSQLVTLAKFGAVILAIDGFDELSDPNGFETAWSGLNSIIRSSRGSATFLLAGRETFISPDLILRKLTSFDHQVDRFAILSIRDPRPDQARHWLLQRDGWDSELLQRDFLEPLFEDRSYALRPFFLEILGQEPEAVKSDHSDSVDLLSYLVDVMIEREATKFLDAFDPVDRDNANSVYREYVERFLEEIARDLAENQTDFISHDALELLSKVAAYGLVPEDQTQALASRSNTIVFLSSDIQPGHYRFSHNQLLLHFLSRDVLRSVGAGEKPRYIRRNLFGRESLEVFSSVARSRVLATLTFIEGAKAGLQQTWRDRTGSNLAALAVAAACAVLPDGLDLEIKNIDVTEVHFPFSTPEGIAFHSCTINIMHSMDIDFSNVAFGKDVYVSTLEINDRTKWPASLPTPSFLVHEEGVVTDAAEIVARLSRAVGGDVGRHLQWPEDTQELIDRIDRYRAFWLRTNADESDRQGKRILSHADWPRMFRALRQLELVTVRSVPASSKGGEFVHFRQDVELSGHQGLFDLLSD